MEPEDSLLCSLEPAIAPNPDLQYRSYTVNYNCENPIMCNNIACVGAPLGLLFDVFIA
jgi:hypothetical protein